MSTVSTGFTDPTTRLSPTLRKTLLGAFVCCCVGFLVGLAAILTLVFGIIIPLQNDVSAHVCEAHLCSEQADGTCPDTKSPLESTLNVLVDLRSARARAAHPAMTE